MPKPEGTKWLSELIHEHVKLPAGQGLDTFSYELSREQKTAMARDFILAGYAKEVQFTHGGVLYTYTVDNHIII